jgi:hypothetical protein
MIDPPRQMAIDRDHPHFHPQWKAIGPAIDILLDGVPAKGVLAYDCDAGTIERFVYDADGIIAIDPERAELQAETVHGRVEVRWRETAHAE